MRRVLFIGALLVASTSAAQLAVSQEQILTGPVPKYASGTQSNESIASDGSSYFTVWQDDREGLGFDLWARVVPLSGALAAPAFSLVRLPGNQTQPVAAYAAGTFLVAWVDDTAGASPSNLYAQAFDAQGTALSIAMKLSANGQVASKCAIAVDSSTNTFLVVVAGDGAARDLTLARVQANPPMLLTVTPVSMPGNQLRPTAVFDGTNFIVAWDDSRTGANGTDIYGMRVSAMGTVLDGTGLPLVSASGNQQRPCLSRAPPGALLTWESTVAPARIEAFRVNATLTPIDGAPFVVTAGSAAQAELACAGTGLQTLVTATDARMGSSGIWGRVVDEDGGLEPEFLIAQGHSVSTVSATNSGVAVGTMFAPSIAGPELYARRLGANFGVLDAAPVMLTAAAPRAQAPRVAFASTSYVVTWLEEARNGCASDSAAQIVAAGSGALVFPDAGFSVTTGACNRTATPWAAGSAAASQFFISWGDHGSGTSTYYGRVSEAGATLDGNGRGNGGSGYTSASTWHAGAWANFWIQVGIRLRRISPVNGQPVDAAPTQIAPALGAESGLVATSVGPLAFVSWSANTDAGANDVVFARVDADAGVLDPLPVIIAGGAGRQESPAIATNGSELLLAWVDRAVGGGDIFATRLALDGTVIQPRFLVASGAVRQDAPAVAWSGTHWMVAWQETSGVDSNIVGARLDAAGTLIDAVPTVLAGETEPERLPSLASGPTGEMLLSYERFDGRAEVQAYRARTRFVWDREVDAGSDGGQSGDGGEYADAGLQPTDAGVADAGNTDAGNTDAGPPDSGSGDAGLDDGGLDDGGADDGGLGDAGLDDGGSDGGLDDGGPSIDPSTTVPRIMSAELQFSCGVFSSYGLSIQTGARGAFSATGLPAGVIFDEQGLAISGAPLANTGGTYEVTVTHTTDAGRASTDIELRVECVKLVQSVSCGCSTNGSLVLGTMLLVLALRLRKVR